MRAYTRKHTDTHGQAHAEEHTGAQVESRKGVEASERVQADDRVAEQGVAALHWRSLPERELPGALSRRPGRCRLGRRLRQSLLLLLQLLLLLLELLLLAEALDLRDDFAGVPATKTGNSQ